jgi:hypothetical protein
MDPALPDCSHLTTRRYVEKFLRRKWAEETGNWADRDLLIGQMGSSGALAGAAVIGPLNQRHPIPCGLQTLHKAIPVRTLCICILRKIK